MSDTTFTNGVTLTDSDWFNDLNRLHYTILGDPATAIAALNALTSNGADIASSGTINLTTATGDCVDVTGTNAITAITLADGDTRAVRFTGALTLTNGASLVLPGAANITTAAGDYAIFRGYSAGVVRCEMFSKASQHPVNTLVTNSLSGDVTLSNTAAYFDGPSVAQGTVGTWFVTGTVTLLDAGASGDFNLKLWDGTTVIASADHRGNGAGNYVAVSLSGYIASPVANIRISVKDTVTTTTKIVFNATGNSKDSTLSAMRVA